MRCPCEIGSRCNDKRRVENETPPPGHNAPLRKRTRPSARLSSASSPPSSRLEPDRKPLQPADEHRFDPPRLARQFDALQPRQQFLPHVSHLPPRNMLAKPAMRATAEHALLVLSPSRVEGAGSGDQP